MEVCMEVLYGGLYGGFVWRFVWEVQLWYLIEYLQAAACFRISEKLLTLGKAS